MQLTSSSFGNGAAIPREFTCDGEDLSPPLEWRGAPTRAQSYVLLCDDPDAPAGTWHHWAAYDIPASLTELLAGASMKAGRFGFKQAINDFKRAGYGGPCPPSGHGPHHYRFQLLALSIAALPIPTGRTCLEVEREARQHAIAEAMLTGVYQRWG
jgi:Raf kinase inhibitor-like YbhB/YbcL family protein